MSAPDGPLQLGSMVFPVVLLVGLFSLWRGATQGAALLFWAGVALSLVGGAGTALLAWMLVGSVRGRLRGGGLK